MKPTRKPKIDNRKSPPTDWGKVANWYDDLVGEEGSEFQREIIFPGVLRMLALKAGEKVLDLACGQGAFCRLLHEKGGQVTGVDAATELIKIARERSEPAIQYIVGDARELSFLPEKNFTAASCILAIQNIDKIQPVFDSVARVLAPGGRFAVVMMHPCFRGPKFTRWGWDEKESVQFRRVDRYLLPRKEPIVTHPGQKTGEYTWSFHRPMQAYIRHLRNAGMLVDHMEEWASHKKSTSGPRAPAENQSRSEIPMFLALRGIKPS
jgi:ubiquinone/menaquinone biosynthesis C-methylase UbiE